VVLQALEDIESRPIGSAAFAEAVAFFTRTGVWGESRALVGDFLDIHPEELAAIGRRSIAARHTREALSKASRSAIPGQFESPLKLPRMVNRRRSGGCRAPRMELSMPQSVPASYATGEDRPRL
jgi:hypothetical protein